MAKCGVTHTGQRHQFDKFKRIVGRIGHYPQRVVVCYVNNDPINDYAHPHTTVIGGFKVDTVEFEGSNLVKRDLSAAAAALRSWEEEQARREAGHATISGVHDIVLRYSLVANVGKFVKYLLKQRLSERRNLYDLVRQVSLGDAYPTSPWTEPNRRVIQEWKADSTKNGYELVFVLIPMRPDQTHVGYFSGLRKFLGDNGVAYIDLAVEFKNSGRDIDSLYWAHDVHFNNAGNAFVGEILAQRLR